VEIAAARMPTAIPLLSNTKGNTPMINHSGLLRSNNKNLLNRHVEILVKDCETLSLHRQLRTAQNH
jgi:hypothetical protein